MENKLSLRYKASSGALVFGAGTVQWSWGLDNFHDAVTGMNNMWESERLGGLVLGATWVCWLQTLRYNTRIGVDPAGPDPVVQQATLWLVDSERSVVEWFWNWCCTDILQYIAIMCDRRAVRHFHYQFIPVLSRNLFADMGVQAPILGTGMVRPSPLLGSGFLLPASSRVRFWGQRTQRLL